MKRKERWELNRKEREKLKREVINLNKFDFLRRVKEDYNIIDDVPNDNEEWKFLIPSYEVNYGYNYNVIKREIDKILEKFEYDKLYFNIIDITYDDLETIYYIDIAFFTKK